MLATKQINMGCLSDINLLTYADFSRKILLVGDIKLDVIKTCTCSKISAEAPIPVNHESGTMYSISGAPAVARYLHGMGIGTDLVAVKGTSDTVLQQRLEEEKFGTSHVVSLEGYCAEVTTKYYTNGCQTFQSVKPCVLSNTPELEYHILEEFTDLITMNRYALVFVMFSSCCAITKRLVKEVIKLSKYFKTPTVVRALGRECVLFEGASVLIAEKAAALEYNRAKSETCKDDYHLMKIMYQTLGIKDYLILLSETDLSYYKIEQEDKKSEKLLLPQAIPMNKLIAVDNAINAAIVFGRACEMDIDQTCALATHCVENVCKQGNEISVNLTEILPSKVIRNKDELINFMNLLPKHKKIVVTTGCFDLLHAGHVENLRMAKELGDILIVLLNTDGSVKELKSQTRPVYPLDERIWLLQAVKHVDYIVPFDEKEPRWQLATIDPHVFAKGDEYSEEKIMKQFPFLKQYRAIPTIKALSTTNTIKNVISLNAK